MAGDFDNISFDGSPVRFRLESPLLICLDPLSMGWVREEIAALPAARADGGIILSRVNTGLSEVSCYCVENFEPGIHILDPRDIRKFNSDEDEDLDLDELQEKCNTADAPVRYRFVGVDSGALVFVDFAHFCPLLELLTWEQYDLALRGDDGVFEKIITSLGGPYFALITGNCLPGMDFDGDGTYTIEPGAIKKESEKVLG